MSLKITIEVDSLSDLCRLKPLIDAALLPETEFPMLSSLNLEYRTRNCLEGAGIKSVRDLLDRTENDLLNAPMLGRKSLNEIKEVLAIHGLRLKAGL